MTHLPRFARCRTSCLRPCHVTQRVDRIFGFLRKCEQRPTKSAAYAVFYSSVASILVGSVLAWSALLDAQIAPQTRPTHLVRHRSALPMVSGLDAPRPVSQTSSATSPRFQHQPERSPWAVNQTVHSDWQPGPMRSIAEASLIRKRISLRITNFCFIQKRSCLRRPCFRKGLYPAAARWFWFPAGVFVGRRHPESMCMPVLASSIPRSRMASIC